MLIDLETYDLPTQPKRIAIMMRNSDIELKGPSYTTILDPIEAKADLDRQIAKVMATLEASEPKPFQGLPPSVAPPDKPKAKVRVHATPWPPLPLPAHAKRPKGPMTAQESASAFLDWMRARGATGCFTSSELGTHYRIFTKAMDGRPAAGDHMRHELKRLSCVIKSQDDRRNEQLGGRRSRHTVWELREAPPMRRAA